MTLKEFEAKLAAIIGRPTDLRPFVCEGSPMDCRVMLVGFNPTTPAKDFWACWRAGYGYDKRGWLADYQQQRVQEGKRLNSNSREIMDRIGQGAGSLLEANIYPKASKDARSLKERDPRAFRLLMEAVKPRVIVAHGREAADEIDAHTPACRVMKVPHFSRGWSYLKALELGRELGR